jgi:protein associated with RNAse G/E
MTKARDLANNALGSKPKVVDAKGDLIVASADDTAVRVAIGANDTVLTADSSTTSGVKWAASAAFTSYYINSTSATPIDGNNLTIPEGDYTATIISDNDVVEIDNIGYGKGTSGYLSSLSDIDFIGKPAGLTWTVTNLSLATIINNVVFGNGIFVGAMQSGSVITSTDGITWTTRDAGFGTTVIAAIVYGNDLFIVGGNTALISTSTDGVTWTTRGTIFASGYVNCLAYGNNLYLAGGNDGQLATSTDGTTWTTRTSNFTAGTTIINGIAYGNGIYVAVGNSNRTTISTDGITWTSGSANFGASPNGIQTILFNRGQFFIGGDSGKASTSTDGIAWVPFNPSTTTTIQRIAYGNGLLVATCQAGVLTTSYDGITWVSKASNFGNTRILGAAFGNGVYIAVGYNSLVGRSTQSGTFQASFIPVSETINLP